MPVRTYLYDADGHDREVELTAELLESLGPQRLLWIDIDHRDPKVVAEVGELLKLPDEILSSLNDRPSNRVETHGTFTHFSLHTAPATLSDGGDAGSRRNQVAGARLDFVVDQEWLLTVHDGVVSFIDAFRSEDRAETMIGELTPHDFTASLLDTHLEAFFEEVERIEVMVDRLDEQALTKPSSRNLLARLVTLRRRVSRLRTLLSRQRAIFYGLSRPDLQIVAQSGAAPHFQVLTGRFERAIDEVEHTRDLVVGSFELFASRSAQQTNDLVKVLTYLTAVIGICAAVAGIFGMNFETRFFEHGDAGFYATIVILAALVLLSTVLARWRGWL